MESVYKGDIVVMDVIWCQICVSMIEKGDIFVLSWARVRRSVGRYLFRAANVWWRCAQYFVLPLLTRCLERHRCR